MLIASLSAAYHQLPLKNPFILSIRSATNANVIRWILSTDDGREYLGESVPVQYVTGETPESVLTVQPRIENLLNGRDVSDMFSLLSEMSRAFPTDVAARAGVEIALYSAYASLTGVSVAKLLGGEDVTVETDLTISRLPNAADIAQEAWRQGFRIFKLKVGGGAMEEDVDRVLGITSLLPEAIIRLDANQALTVQSTMELTEMLLRNRVNIELIEQPVPKEDLAALDELARVSPVPIIADEACCSPSDATRLFLETAVQGVNVKLMK